MAFLVTDIVTGAKVVGPKTRVEETNIQFTAPGALGFVTMHRTVYELIVMWPIDATGGEAVPATWSVGGDTYTLETTDPGIGYDNRLGILTAVYNLVGDWA